MEELLRELAFNPTINPYFSGCTDLAYEYFRNPSRDHKYERRMKDLLVAAREHRDAFKIPTTRGVALVHQFFPERAGHVFPQGVFEEYLKRLSRYYERASITLVETVQEYPFSAAHLLEEGLVNDVVFSQMNHGHLLNDQPLPEYFGGCYGDYCVRHAMPKCAKKLKDIILEHPGLL